MICVYPLKIKALGSQMGMSAKEIVSFKEFEDLLIKATNTANEGITISSMDQPDRPLVFVNNGFERLTGYTKKDVIGKNCRFLQGNDTDKAPVEELRRAIKNGEQTTVELLNYKKDGTPFWNRLSITPLKDKNGIEIYEGDIVKATSDQYENKNFVGKVIFDEGYFCTWVNKNDIRGVWSGDDIEVIGNIFENKDLLEKEH